MVGLTCNRVVYENTLDLMWWARIQRLVNLKSEPAWKSRQTRKEDIKEYEHSSVRHLHWHQYHCHSQSQLINLPPNIWNLFNSPMLILGCHPTWLDQVQVLLFCFVLFVFLFIEWFIGRLIISRTTTEKRLLQSDFLSVLLPPCMLARSLTTRSICLRWRRSVHV